MWLKSCISYPLAIQFRNKGNRRELFRKETQSRVSVDRQVSRERNPEWLLLQQEKSCDILKTPFHAYSECALYSFLGHFCKIQSVNHKVKTGFPEKKTELYMLDFMKVEAFGSIN